MEQVEKQAGGEFCLRWVCVFSVALCLLLLVLVDEPSYANAVAAMLSSGTGTGSTKTQITGRATMAGLAGPGMGLHFPMLPMSFIEVCATLVLLQPRDVCPPSCPWPMGG